MKIAWVPLACTLVATFASGTAYAQKRIDAGTCARNCSAWCAKNMPGQAMCPDRCTTKQCNR